MDSLLYPPTEVLWGGSCSLVSAGDCQWGGDKVGWEGRDLYVLQRLYAHGSWSVVGMGILNGLNPVSRYKYGNSGNIWE